MSSKDKRVKLAKMTHPDLKALSTEELQQQLDAYALHGCADLLQEIRFQQIELELQRRELQASQQPLVTNLKRIADLFNHAPVCFISVDNAGCIHEINLAGVRLLGVERERLLGNPLPLWLECGDNGQIFFAHLKQARESGRVETIELRLTPTGHDQMDVRMSTVVDREEIHGKPSYSCVIIDISAQKRAERESEHQAQQLRLITDAIPVYIAYVDIHGVYRFANKTYAAWVGKSQAEIIGKKKTDVLWPSVYAKFEEYIRVVLAGRPVNFEITIKIPGGDRQDINANLIPDFAADGSILGYFIVNQDITESRRLEALDKIHMQEMARVARINTMGEMVAELAHELNQPLAAITIYSDAVRRMLNKRSGSVPEMQKALNEIRLQAERAGEVISRLREFVSKREIHNEKIQINDIIEEVINLIAAEARWHGVVVRLELGEAIVPVMVNRILIEQVILNLARNAIEAMETTEQHKRSITIRTSHGTHNEVVVAVEDTGPGLRDAEIEHIFEPFYTTKAQGMGMGLAISRSIIKAHHGRLWAISNEDGGMSFTFTLPHQLEDSQKEETK